MELRGYEVEAEGAGMQAADGMGGGDDWVVEGEDGTRYMG